MLKETIGAATLYCCDNRELLPTFETGSINWCVTSPPYNLNKDHSGHNNKELQSAQSACMEAKYDEWYDDELLESDYQEQQKAILRELCRITTDSVFYNHRIRYAWHSRNKNPPPSKILHPLMWLQEFPIWDEIIWDRAGGGLPHGRSALGHEYVYQLKRPRNIISSTGHTSVWKIPPVKNSLHVCAFPTKLVKQCLVPYYQKGESVIDPFMGSAQVGVAAMQLGLSFIGIERSPKFFEAACINLESNYRARLAAGGS